MLEVGPLSHGCNCVFWANQARDFNKASATPGRASKEYAHTGAQNYPCAVNGAHYTLAFRASGAHFGGGFSLWASSVS